MATFFATNNMKPRRAIGAGSRRYKARSGTVRHPLNLYAFHDEKGEVLYPSRKAADAATALRRAVCADEGLPRVEVEHDSGDAYLVFCAEQEKPRRVIVTETHEG